MITKQFKTILLSIALLATVNSTQMSAMSTTESKEAKQPAIPSIKTSARYTSLDTMFAEAEEEERLALLDKELIETVITAGKAIAKETSPANQTKLDKELAGKINKLLVEGANVNTLGEVKLYGIKLQPYAVVEIETRQLMAAIHIAAMNNLTTCLQILINANADLNLQTKVITRANLSHAEGEGKTALHLAAINGHLASVELLVQAEANVNALDNQKQTALLDAIEAEKLDIIKYLLEIGASFNPLDDQKNPTVQITNINVIMAIYEGLRKASARHNWMRITPLLAFCRANPILKSSALPVIDRCIKPYFNYQPTNISNTNNTLKASLHIEPIENDCVIQ